MSLQLGLVLACGLLALLYGAYLVRELLALSQGTKEMQEIAAAIQEGASAYLNRQYTTIAIAGAIIFAAAFYLGWQVAVGYLIGRRWGRRILDSTLGRFVNPRHLDRAEGVLRRRGVWAVFFGRLRHSRAGRAMMALRDDEVVARALGVDVTRAKVIAFASGAAVAGVGGGLYAHYAQYIQYSDFGADKAMSLMTYAVFGGINFWLGGVLGAAILSYMPVLLQVFEHWRLEVHGAIILAVMAVRPQGVLARDFAADVRLFWRRLKTTGSAITGSER